MTNKTETEAPLTAAVREAGEFLDAFRNGGDGRDEVDIQCVNAFGHPPVTVGTLRALHELAASITGIIAEYRDVIPAAADRVAAIPSITCPRCRMTSYNPSDIAHGYCGNCHDWTTDTGVPAKN